jgi:YhcH/YjgK/YiaL family protein
VVKDNIKNISLYFGLGDRIKRGLLYLSKTDFSNTEDGRYEIDGLDIYAMVSRYKTKPREKGIWEAHLKYIDIQFIACGTERIGFSYQPDMKIIEPYNDKNDTQFLLGKGDFITAGKNTFVILFPDDAHMPGIEFDKSKEVIKVVVKVKIE